VWKLDDRQKTALDGQMHAPGEFDGRHPGRDHLPGAPVREDPGRGAQAVARANEDRHPGLGRCLVAGRETGS
jgi:hypothetical protein